MTRPASQAQIKRNALAGIDALEKRGHPVKGVRISVDGRVEVLTETPADALASNDSGDWVALAGKTKVRRA